MTYLGAISELKTIRDSGLVSDLVTPGLQHVIETLEAELEPYEPDELRPCPLCGNGGRLKDSQGRQVRQGWVGCPSCGLYISWKVSPSGAIMKWNRRTL